MENYTLLILVIASILVAIVLGKYLEKLRSVNYGMSRKDFEKEYRTPYFENDKFSDDVVEVPQGTFDWVKSGIIGTGHVHRGCKFNCVTAHYC